MSAPSVTPLPDPPSPFSTPSQFSADAFIFVAALSGWTGDINNLVDWLNANIDAREVVNETGTAFNLNAQNSGAYIRTTNGGAKTLTVQPESVTAQPEGASYFIANRGAGDLTIVAGSGVLINGNVALTENATVILQKIDTDTYDLITIGGDFVTDLTVLQADVATLQSQMTARIQSVATIADLLSLTDITDGARVRVAAYHADFNSGGGEFYWDLDAPKNTHDGGSVIDPNKSFPLAWGDQAQINDWFTAEASGAGCWVRAMEIQELNSLMFGAIYQSAFDPAIAFANRKLNEVMLRNPGFSVFRFPSYQETMWILGSVHPKRSNIKIIHEKGCNVKFRYDHPGYSVPQSGAGFAFPMYADPDTVGSEDFSITGVVENVEYQLDGDVATIYDAGHSFLHNNNCIGFYVAKNCRVTGSGGVSESDHNGINFDGMCTNIDIDISYLRGTSDTPIVVNGPDPDDVIMTDRGYANIRVGTISDIKFDNAASRSNIIVGHQSSADVWVSIIDGNPLLKGNGVSSFGCDNTKFKFGRLSFVSNALNQYETEHGSVNGCTLEGADAIVRRGGVVADKHRTVEIQGISAKGSTALTIYRDDAPLSTFDRLSVRNCDFSGVSANVTPYGPSIFSLGRPTSILYSDNKPGANWVTNSEIWNRQTKLPVTATNAASTTFNYDMAGTDGDYPYTKLNGYISSSSQFYEYSLDLTLIAKTSTTIKRVVKHTDGTDLVITAARSGSVVTITLTFTTAAVLGLWQVFN